MLPYVCSIPSQTLVWKPANAAPLKGNIGEHSSERC